MFSKLVRLFNAKHHATAIDRSLAALLIAIAAVAPIT